MWSSCISALQDGRRTGGKSLKTLVFCKGILTVRPNTLVAIGSPDRLLSSYRECCLILISPYLMSRSFGFFNLLLTPERN